MNKSTNNRITTSITWDMMTLAVLDHQFYVYEGPRDWCGGASDQQKDIEATQSAFYKTLTSEYQTTFGESQGILSALTKSFQPILAKGINQEGFSKAELDNLNSQAVTGTGQNYAKAADALGKAQASQDGGGAYIPSGARMQQQRELATSAAANESGIESNITAADYSTGRSNYLAAAQILGSTAAEYNPVGMAGSANSAGSAASQTANEITQANNSWMNMVGAGLGAAGSALGGGSLGKIMGH